MLLFENMIIFLFVFYLIFNQYNKLLYCQDKWQIYNNRLAPCYWCFTNLCRFKLVIDAVAENSYNIYVNYSQLWLLFISKCEQNIANGDYTNQTAVTPKKKIKWHFPKLYANCRLLKADSNLCIKHIVDIFTKCFKCLAWTKAFKVASFTK